MSQPMQAVYVVKAAALGEAIKEALCTSQFYDSTLSPGHINGERKWGLMEQRPENSVSVLVNLCCKLYNS